MIKSSSDMVCFQPPPIPRQSLGLACCSMLQPNAQGNGRPGRQKTYGHRDGRQEPHVPVSLLLLTTSCRTPLHDYPCGGFLQHSHRTACLEHSFEPPFYSTLLDRSCRTLIHNTLVELPRASNNYDRTCRRCDGHVTRSHPGYTAAQHLQHGPEKGIRTN